jgi:toxin ParE1/3/4
MSLTVQFSPEAIADLCRMYDYIALHGGKNVAASYIARIHQYCLDMNIFPERGTRRDDIWKGLRIMGFERKVTITIEVISD